MTIVEKSNLKLRKVHGTTADGNPAAVWNGRD
jgi:hypothetical protein